MTIKHLLLAVALLFASFSALAEDVLMSDLTLGQELLVSKDGEQFTTVKFSGECFVPTANGLESMALIESSPNDSIGNWEHTTTADGRAIKSTVLNAGSVCKTNGERAYLVPKSQLLGVLTQLSNIVNSDDDTAKALRALADVFTNKEEVGAELAEIRRIIVNED